MAALFATRLRRLRLNAGLTQTQLGHRTHTHPTRINQLERTTGAKPTLELTRSLDKAVGGDELLTELWPHVYRETYPDWAKPSWNARNGLWSSGSSLRQSCPVCCRPRTTPVQC
ncbi:helix-turn-helix transcriptional regulator [Streptomyces sp. Edi2]|uniref:helix-turn-helix domain-containing protein n=1 Tax=Streptomyces sp. Edi2 TaxID=3162528 RepID=UPI00330637D3